MKSSNTPKRKTTFSKSYVSHYRVPKRNYPKLNPKSRAYSLQYYVDAFINGVYDNTLNGALNYSLCIKSFEERFTIFHILNENQIMISAQRKRLGRDSLSGIIIDKDLNIASLFDNRQF